VADLLRWRSRARASGFCSREQNPAYVPITVMWRAERPERSCPGGARADGHITRYRELSQVSKDLSSFQTARPRPTSEVSAPSSQLRNASALARSISSAYRLVVSKLACPSHPRMTLTSTPDSSK